MKHHKFKSTKELAKHLGLSEARGIEAELKAKMMLKIKELVKEKELTHQEVADLSGVGRTVITGIVNSNIQSITMGRLLKVLVSLGVEPEIRFKESA